jgi:hypothetical protein
MVNPSLKMLKSSYLRKSFMPTIGSNQPDGPWGGSDLPNATHLRVGMTELPLQLSNIIGMQSK